MTIERDLSRTDRYCMLIEATAVRLAPTTVLSHGTAAVIHGIPVLEARLDRIYALTVRGNGKRSAHLHTRRRTLDDDEIVEFELPRLGRVKVTSQARTLADLARTLPFPEVIAAFDGALAAGADLDALDASGRLGTRIALARTFADARAESFGESLSRAMFAQAGLPAPELQLAHATPAGEFVGRSDFAWDDVVGEFDGKVKYGALLRPGESAADAIMREKRREAQLQDLGKTVVRWQWSSLFPPNALVRRLARAMSAPPLRPRRELLW